MGTPVRDRDPQEPEEQEAQGLAASNWPEPEVLIARGKYTTLSRERYAQIDRVQMIVTTMISEAHGVLRDCQRADKQPPQEPGRMQQLSKCLENLGAARSKIEELCKDLQILQKEAWE